MLLAKYGTTMKIITTSSLLVICSLLCAQLALADTYYKWKNEKDNWTYGAHPPPGANAIAIKTSSGGKVTTTAPSTPTDQNEATNTNTENAAETTTAAKAEGKPKKSKKEKEKLCKTAKSNLEALSAKAIIRMRDADGNVTVLADDQREAEIEKAKKIMKENC